MSLGYPRHACKARHMCTRSCLRFLRLWEFVQRERGLGGAAREAKTAALSELI